MYRWGLTNLQEIYSPHFKQKLFQKIRSQLSSQDYYNTYPKRTKIVEGEVEKQTKQKIEEKTDNSLKVKAFLHQKIPETKRKI